MFYTTIRKVQISINVHMRVDRPYPCARLRIKNQLEIESFKRIELHLSNVVAVEAMDSRSLSYLL